VLEYACLRLLCMHDWMLALCCACTIECLCVCLRLCARVRVRVCMLVCLCLCICVCVCVCSRDVNGDQDEVIHSRVRFVGATKKYCN
jgi:hypothetical protein